MEPKKDNDEDSDRLAIREELSQMSFEDLQKLKEKLGSKCYNDTVFGKTKKKDSKPALFKRENKNRPREVSSKIPVKTFQDVLPVKKKVCRDPRFDNLCGTFNEKAFENAYSFVKDIKAEEKEELYRELKATSDETRQGQIKYLIQRLENQERELNRQKTIKEKKKQQRESEIESLRQGKKPLYIKKSEQKMIDLVDRYEELKKHGKLKKQIEKIRKKQSVKDRKKIKIFERVSN